MKFSLSGAISSTLSPHAEPFFSRLRSSSAVADSSIGYSPVSSIFQTPVPNAIVGNQYKDQYSGYAYHFSDGWVPSPVSASHSSYSSPNAKPAPSPCLTLKRLEIACDSSSKLSSDDDSLIDSPCYKGRNWSQITPLHMGETSPPPRVTAEKLAEEQNMSVAVTTIASLMVSHEKENALSVPVSGGFLGSSFDIGLSGENPVKRKFEFGSNREGILQTIVDLSNMLLQIPFNGADLPESDDKMLKVILEDLKKLLEEYKKGYIRKLAKAYRLDKEKGKTDTCSTSCSQPQICYIDDNRDNIEATVYENLWMSAEIKKT